MDKNLSCKLTEMASGRWLDIFSALSNRLDKAIQNMPSHVPCPRNIGGNDSFRLFKDAKHTGGSISNQIGGMPSGIQTLMWVNEWDFKTTLRELCVYFQIGDKYTKPRVLPPVVNVEPQRLTDEQIGKRRNALRYVYKQSFPLNDPRSNLALIYFKNRGLEFKNEQINQLSTDVRFHPSLQFWHENKCLGNFPCIVSIVKNNKGEAVTLHKTYLNNDGYKLDVSKFSYIKEKPNAKQIMPPCTRNTISGCSIQLFGFNKKQKDQLSIAEGLETSLSVALATGESCWVTISASWMRKFMPPPEINHLTIWADLDKTEVGQKTACFLMERLYEKIDYLTISSFVPPVELNSKSYDWNDYYREFGISGFERFNIRPIY